MRVRVRVRVQWVGMEGCCTDVADDCLVAELCQRSRQRKQSRFEPRHPRCCLFRAGIPQHPAALRLRVAAYEVYGVEEGEIRMIDKGCTMCIDTVQHSKEA